MRARLPLLLIHVTEVATLMLTVEGSKPPDSIDTLTLPVGVQPGPGVPVVVPVAPGVVVVVPVEPGVVVPVDPGVRVVVLPGVVVPVLPGVVVPVVPGVVVSVEPGVVVSVLPAVPVAPGVVVSEASGDNAPVLAISMPANFSELAEAVEASNTSPSLSVVNLKKLPEKRVAPNITRHKAAKVTTGRYHPRRVFRSDDLYSIVYILCHKRVVQRLM